jgi:hypothetical protein
VVFLVQASNGAGEDWQNFTRAENVVVNGTTVVSFPILPPKPRRYCSDPATDCTSRILRQRGSIMEHDIFGEFCIQQCVTSLFALYHALGWECGGLQCF